MGSRCKATNEIIAIYDFSQMILKVIMTGL